jgi:predicted aspartyl protease
LWLSLFVLAQEPVERAPLRYAPPTLLVQARINNGRPLWFAFDTGSTTCLLDARIAPRLGLGPGERSLRARTLAVGRAVTYDVELAVRDLAPLSQQVGRPVAGILGFTWMEQFVFEIDYGAARLTLWPRTAELPATADALPLPLELHSTSGLTGATLHLPIVLDGEHRCPARLDTGAGAGSLALPMASKVGADLGQLRAASVTGERASHTVARLDVAGRSFSNVRFYVDARHGGESSPYAQCLLGNEQLKEFVVTIDIPHRRALFRRALPALTPAQ